MRLIYAHRSEDFFGPVPYPLDLDAVEARDGSNDAIRFLLKQLPPAPARVADMGCGHGRHAGPLSNRGYDVSGVDISPRCIRRARERFPALALYVADIARMPFNDAQFDAVYSLYSSLGEHGASSRCALTEAARITRPGGILLLDVANHQPLLSVFHEPVPGGWATGVRWRGFRQVQQRNLVVSRSVVGVYRLSHERVARALPELAHESGWDVANVWSGFAHEPFCPRSRRLVIRAVRR